jgi:hypothetical protein
LKSDLDGTAVVLPNQVVLFRFTHPWMIARQKVELSTLVPGRSDLAGKSKPPTVTTIKQLMRLTVGFIDGAGVVWDQQYKQGRTERI